MATLTNDLSRRMALFEPSRSVTEILKLAERPDVISLAGGLPDPAVFSLDAVRESMERVLRDEGAAAMNYGPNPGYTRLREWIASRMGDRENVAATAANVLVASGGVEGMNLAAMALIDKGDTVLVEAPTYMVALHIFHTYEARIEAVPADDDGMNADALEAKLKELASKKIRPRLLYVIPSFQNPSGRTMPEARRRRVVELCREYGVPILEDHAYAELVYDGEPMPSLKALDPENVIFVHTFSKIFGPGVRLGWIAAEASMIERFGLCKLGTDQCANTFTQRLVYDYASRGGIEDQVSRAIELYRGKRDAMERAMKEHFPKDATWVHPRGGFFLWVRLAEGADTEEMLKRAIAEEKTAFVAGPPFFPDGSGKNYMRLCFSYVPEEQIAEAIERVARAVHAGAAIAARVPGRQRGDRS